MYDPSAVESIVASMPSQPALVALIVHGSSPSWAPVPVLAHLPGDVDAEQESDSADMKICSYGNAESSYFVVPSAGPKAYSPTDAAIAHTRSLVFLRERLGGPYFDLEQIWEEHTHYEFVDRSVSKTMGTMVVSLALRPCPVVRHVAWTDLCFPHAALDSEHVITAAGQSECIVQAQASCWAQRAAAQTVCGVSQANPRLSPTSTTFLR